MAKEPNELKQELLKLSSQMVRGDNMPLEYWEDWDWPKGIQASSWQKVEESSIKARTQAKEWGIAIGQIARLLK